MPLPIGDPIIPGDYPNRDRMLTGADAYLTVKEAFDFTIDNVEAVMLAISANGNLPPFLFNVGNLGQADVIDQIRSAASLDGMKYVMDFIKQFWTPERLRRYTVRRARPQSKKRARGRWISGRDSSITNRMKIRVPHA